MDRIRLVFLNIGKEEMEGYPRKNEEGCPKLLDLIPKERQWVVKMEQETSHGACSEEKKLELRLGPPGGDESSNLSVGCFSNNTGAGTKRGFMDTTENGNQAHVFSKACPWSSSSSANYQGKGQQQLQQQTKASSFLLLQSTSTQCPLPAVVMSKESSQHCCSNKAVDWQNTAEKKAFSPPSAAANTAVPNSSTTAQKRYSQLLVIFFLVVCFVFSCTEDSHYFPYMNLLLGL